MMKDKERSHLIKTVPGTALPNVTATQPRGATILKDQITNQLTKKTHYFATFMNAKELGVLDL